MNFLKITLLFLFLAPRPFQSPQLKKLWESLPEFKRPESIIYHPEKDVLFVSNVNGNPTEKDSNGFISMVNLTGKIENLKWATGMDAPKGMAFNEGYLYVTDIDRVHKIALESGAIEQTFPISDASFLNDLTIASDGRIFISDTQTNKIYCLERNQITTFYECTGTRGPNGLFLKQDSLFIGTKNNIIAISIYYKNFLHTVPNTGPVDGIHVIHKGEIYTSNFYGKLNLIENRRINTLLDTTSPSSRIADFCLIPEKNMILIPNFYDKIIAYSIPVGK